MSQQGDPDNASAAGDVNRLDLVNSGVLRQLVDDHGSSDNRRLTGFEESIKIAQSLKRFNFNLTPTERAAQQDSRVRLLQQTVLPKFEVKDEEQFEDWVDSAALMIKRSRLSVELTQEAWIAAANVKDSTRIQGIDPPETHEGLVDAVAKAMRFGGRGIYRLRAELTKPARCSSAAEAQQFVEHRLARLYRWCLRWKETYTVGDSEVLTIARMCMPAALEDDNRRFYVKGQTWDDLWERATIQEEWMVEKYGKLVQPMGAFPAYPGDGETPINDTTMVNADSNKRQTLVKGLFLHQSQV